MWVNLFATIPADKEERHKMAIKKALVQLAADGGWEVKWILRDDDGREKIIYKIKPDKRRKKNVQV